VTVILFSPDGTSFVYPDAKVTDSLVPDLHFTATHEGKRMSIATTLSYMIIAPVPEAANG
jgi:hypothetical protein